MRRAKTSTSRGHAAWAWPCAPGPAVDENKRASFRETPRGAELRAAEVHSLALGENAKVAEQGNEVCWSISYRFSKEKSVFVGFSLPKAARARLFEKAPRR